MDAFGAEENKMKTRDLSDVKQQIEKDLKIKIESDDLDEIYSQVKQIIIGIHPNNFTNDEIQVENVEKTKVATNILADLKKMKEAKIVSETGLSVIIEKKQEIDNLEFKTIIKENELLQLKQELFIKNEKIKELESKIKELYKNIATINNTKNNESKESLIKLLSPKKGNFITAGSALTILVAYNTIGQLEVLSKKVLLYLPVPQIVINTLIFIILGFSLIWITYRKFRADYIRHFLDRVVIQKNIVAISEYIDRGQINRQQIHEYISKLPLTGSYLKKLLNNLYCIKDELIIEEAVNIFIAYLVQNGYIEHINVKDFIPNYKLRELSLSDVWRLSRDD